jgi:hypothetical protein
MPSACWRHLEPERRQELIAGLIKGIEEEAAASRKKSGVQAAGPAAVLAHHPHTRPDKLKTLSLRSEVLLFSAGTFPRAVLAHHPHTRPDKLKKGPAPLSHAATSMPPSSHGSAPPRALTLPSPKGRG